MAGLEPIVVFWTGWGLHFVVLLSFTVQVTLLLLADLRRRHDWAVLKVVIWSAYMLADTTAIYALGHMSVVFRWSPEHHGQLMALWAPLLLVHLGGQDNITAYAIEDNRLWLRHLQTFVVQVAAAVYVLYVSSILFHPSKLRSAAILMLLVGLLKYGERIWALMRADSCCSSSLSARSYDKALSAAGDESNDLAREMMNERNRHLILAYSLLDVPKQMFEGPTTYVQISSNIVENNKLYGSTYMLNVVKMQLSMMYDLLYTKAAVVHTWYGLCSRVLISLPFTVAALALFHSMLSQDAVAAYRRVDVTITHVLLIGAVVLEIMSVLRAIFSKWTAVLLYGRGWNTIGDMVFSVELGVSKAMGRLVRNRALYLLIKMSRRICCTWCSNTALLEDLLEDPMGRPLLECRMRRHKLFVLMSHHDDKYSVGRKVAKRMGVENWWDSNVYSSSTKVPVIAIGKVLKLVSSTTIEEITRSWGQNAVRRNLNNNVADTILIEPEMKLEDRILVWHIATDVYHSYAWSHERGFAALRYVAIGWHVGIESKVLADYMFFLLAARPYMLPYPVSRQAYAQLCTDAETHLRSCSLTDLRDAVLHQKEDLMKGNPLRKGIGRRQPSMMDRGCQLAAKLIHITEQAQAGENIFKDQADETTRFSDIVAAVVDMLLEVWVEMLCYTAYLCNETSHGKHLTDGGDIMTFVTLMMIYQQNGLFGLKNTSGPVSNIGCV